VCVSNKGGRVKHLKAESFWDRERRNVFRDNYVVMSFVICILHLSWLEYLNNDKSVICFDAHVGSIRNAC